MGLDMYIVLENKMTKKLEDFAYYRKFNALYGYLAEKFQLENPCQLELTEEIIADLIEKLTLIEQTPEAASQILPVSYGPFFGSYSYGSIYYHYIRESLKDMQHLLYIDKNKYRIFFLADF